MARSKKAPGEDLEATLKSNLENMSEEDLRKKASEVALYRQARQDTMKADLAVKEAREALARELEDYKSEIKGADKQIGYIKFLLESRGKL